MDKKLKIGIYSLSLENPYPVAVEFPYVEGAYQESLIFILDDRLAKVRKYNFEKEDTHYWQGGFILGNKVRELRYINYEDFSSNHNMKTVSLPVDYNEVPVKIVVVEGKEEFLIDNYVCDGRASYIKHMCVAANHNKNSPVIFREKGNTTPEIDAFDLNLVDYYGTKHKIQLRGCMHIVGMNGEEEYTKDDKNFTSCFNIER